MGIAHDACSGHAFRHSRRRRACRVAQYWPAGASQLLPAAISQQTTGRCAQSLLEDETFSPGHYELTFHVADYFHSRGVPLPRPGIHHAAVIRIGIADASQHYHVPLLITPWSYWCTGEDDGIGARHPSLRAR